MPNCATRTSLTPEQFHRFAMRAKVHRDACLRASVSTVIVAAARVAGFAGRGAMRMSFGTGWSSGLGKTCAASSQKGAVR
jgi:hypothetical protein